MKTPNVFEHTGHFLHFLRTGVPQWGQGFFLPGFLLSRRRGEGEGKEGEGKEGEGKEGEGKEGEGEEGEGEEGEVETGRTTYCNITLFEPAYIICAMQHG